MNSKWKTAIIWLGGIAIIVLIVFIGMKDSIARPINEEKANAMKSDSVNVEEYYKEKSEIVTSYDVKTSDKIKSEKQTVEDINGRGFDQYPISYEYSIDGEYIKEQEALNKKEKHPVYRTYYTSTSGELWTIIVTNGSMVANPVSYNMQSNRGVQLIFAESEIITGYDSQNNMFYETVPKESELIVHVVDKIDAETLDSLTVEVINGL